MQEELQSKDEAIASLRKSSGGNADKLNSLLAENASLNAHLEETKAALCHKDEELSTLALSKQKVEGDLDAAVRKLESQVRRLAMSEFDLMLNNE